MQQWAAVHSSPWNLHIAPSPGAAAQPYAPQQQQHTVCLGLVVVVVGGVEGLIGGGGDVSCRLLAPPLLQWVVGVVGCSAPCSSLHLPQQPSCLCVDGQSRL